MEIKEVKSATVAKLDGGLYAVDGKLHRSFRAAVDALADALGVERKKKVKPPVKK